MAVESDTDRATFFNTDEFGVVATVGASTVDGVFDNEYVDVLDMAGSVPAFICRSSDVTAASIVRGTSLVISGSTYIVRNLKPDNTGITVLVLEAQ